MQKAFDGEAKKLGLKTEQDVRAEAAGGRH